jgi:hypothetical protein
VSEQRDIVERLSAISSALSASGFAGCDATAEALCHEAASEIARLRESLAIFVHAHATGNSVLPHIEEQASALVKEVGK